MLFLPGRLACPKNRNMIKSTFGKKLVLSAGIFFMAYAGVKGQFIISGQAGVDISQAKQFGEIKTRETINQTYQFAPRLAFGLKNMVLGVDLGLRWQDLEIPKGTSSTVQEITREVSVAPFLRMVKKTGDYFGLWLELQPGFAVGDIESNGKENGSFWAVQGRIRPGIIIFINSNWSLETSFGNLGYVFSRNFPTSSTSDYTDVSKFGFNANGGGFIFGVNYAFAKKSVD